MLPLERERVRERDIEFLEVTCHPPVNEVVYCVCRFYVVLFFIVSGSRKKVNH